MLLKLPILLLILDGCDFNHFEWHRRHCVCVCTRRLYKGTLFFHVHYALYAIRLQIKFTPISIFQWMHIRFVSSFIGWLNDFVHNLNVIFFVVINSLIYNYTVLQNIHKNIFCHYWQNVTELQTHTVNIYTHMCSKRLQCLVLIKTFGTKLHH